MIHFQQQKRGDLGWHETRHLNSPNLNFLLCVGPLILFSVSLLLFSLPWSWRGDELKCAGVGPLQWPQVEKRRCLIVATDNKKTRFTGGRTVGKPLWNQFSAFTDIVLRTLLLVEMMLECRFPSVSGSGTLSRLFSVCFSSLLFHCSILFVFCHSSFN